VVAILGGSAAAVAFAAATLCVSVSARRIGPASTLAWVAMSGLCIALPWALVDGMPAGLGPADLAWLAVSGFGNVIGLLFAYSALRVGQVGLVAPIVSTEGAAAALIAVAAGEAISAGVGLALAVIAGGVAVAAASRAPDEVAGRSALRAPSFAVAAALCFGASIYATGRASEVLPLGWVVAPPRVVGTILVALPLLSTAELRLTRPLLPLVVGAGVAEVAGFAAYAVGARHGIAVSAVLASQFAAIAGVAAYFVFRERLTRVQLAGIAAVVGGVAALTLLQA
jgi:drug/metabolite transporter (DMT)-like permease